MCLVYQKTRYTAAVRDPKRGYFRQVYPRNRQRASFTTVEAAMRALERSRLQGQGIVYPAGSDADDVRTWITSIAL